MTGVQLQESSVIVLLYYLVYEDNANVFIRGLQRDVLTDVCVCVCVGGVNQRSLDRATMYCNSSHHLYHPYIT